MKVHLDETLTEAADELSGDYAASVNDYEPVVQHTLAFADLLSSGIMASSRTGSPDHPARSHGRRPAPAGLVEGAEPRHGSCLFRPGLIVVCWGVCLGIRKVTALCRSAPELGAAIGDQGVRWPRR
jgi:hypothetical protein